MPEQVSLMRSDPDSLGTIKLDFFLKVTNLVVESSSKQVVNESENE